MFRQVVGTILRLAVRNADRWLPIHGSHDVPAYGFERLADPPPLEVNTIRLLTEFHGGSLAMAATWAEMLTPRHAGHGAWSWPPRPGRLAEAAERAGEADAGPAMSTERMADALAAFHFPDAAWARVVYDLIVTSALRPGGRRAQRRRARADLLRAGRQLRDREPQDHDRRGRGAGRAPGPRVRAAQAVPRRALDRADRGDRRGCPGCRSGG